MGFLSARSSAADLSRSAGGKGNNLALLSGRNFPVPDWAIIGVDAFTTAVAASGVAWTGQDSGPQLASALDSAELSDSVVDVIDQAYRSVGAGAVAVRSSGMAEDGAEHSFAGQFVTTLGVRERDNVVAAVRRCWASAYSESVLTYRVARGLTGPPEPVAVVIQAMVSARVSGVLFTVDPLTGSHDVTVISAVVGLGEALVSGAVEADTVTVDNATGAVLHTEVGTQDFAIELTEDGSTHERPLGAEGRTSCLTEELISELRLLGQQVAESYGSSGGFDIEWAHDGERLWLLQARPITATGTEAASPTAFDSPVSAELPGAHERRIWDNSNIIESFNGVVSPLTFTAASSIYGRVYRSYAQSLGVGPAQIAQMDQWLPVMLGQFHGRVYYNLIQWYRMVGIAPGYPLNHRVLAVALGVDEPLPKSIADTLRPFTFESPLQKVRSRLTTSMKYIRKFRHIDADTDAFLVAFTTVSDKYDAMDFEAMTGNEVYAHFERMETELIDRWGPMMVLDAILLTSMGVLFGLTKAWLKDAPEWFGFAVASPGTDVESAEPARELAAIANMVRADAELTAFVNTVEPSRGVIELATRDGQSWSRLRDLVESYITRFGYRSVDELKLEAPDLREDPSGLFLMLRTALPEPPESRRSEATEYLDAHLTGFRRRWYEKLRDKTGRALADRERLRFARTRAFGMAKRMLRALGRDLTRRGLLDDFHDVFYLHLDEVRALYRDHADLDLRPRVAARKAVASHARTLVAPSRFETTGVRYTADDLTRAGWKPLADTPSAVAGDVIKGTPSCQGTVTGVAAVVDSPYDFTGGILVAYRTDPGWVAALPSASALLIERGSPLTHVAIVARELGVPTVVQVPELTTRIRSGMTLTIDGTTGLISVDADA